MDLFNILLQSGLITSIIVFYLIVFKKSVPKKGNYSNQGWNYPLKYLCALYAVKRWKSKQSTPSFSETPNADQTDGWDSFNVKAVAVDGTAILLGLRKICHKRQLAEVIVYLQLPDGTRYRLPRHPDTAVGAWECTSADNWVAGGLKIQVLEPKFRLRILYNGLLRRVDDDTTQHVRLNLIWTSGSDMYHHPRDWSAQLAAQALAMEPWRDGKWAYILDRWSNSSWLQWGCVQGRVESYDMKGALEVSHWLRARGYKERSWAPHGYLGLRRDVNIMVTATDGTMVQLKALSHKDVLTHVLSGCVRFPNYDVESIVSTDFSLPDFGEYIGTIPDVYTVNVTTSQGRHVKVVLRMNSDGGQLWSGVPYQYRVLYQTVAATVDGYQASGLLELGYEADEVREPSVPLTSPRVLKWLPKSEVRDVSYCVHLESAAAACPELVGGKGASLALLASVQKEEGYRVPPGFCMTTLALERHLEVNPDLKAAILQIEAASEHYDEVLFREKCDRTVQLFASTPLVEAVKEELLSHLHELREEAIEQNLGPEVRFAVRSSGVGEDGEALSAAGQNDTVLGCVSDEEVLTAVTQCWASMYAFTSAHYRRQNGQACQCGGGVVVQALVRARAAGVLFTRHPAAGHPARVLLTANYGLGESVVSGTVEPDTIVVSKKESGELFISELELGSKKHRVTQSGEGVTTVAVPDSERNVPCLSETEALRLAMIGVVQEELWGAPRDIEWAVFENEIFLLQARPITSSERWSEEELLHETDSPIMSDDAITTFANTGEVMPKPMSPLSLDLMLRAMTLSIYRILEDGTCWHNFKSIFGITHYRVYIESCNLFYRQVNYAIDMIVKMADMAFHGHLITDTEIIEKAAHVHPPSLRSRLFQYYFLLYSLLWAKWFENKSIKSVKKMHVDTSSEDPVTILENIENCKERLLDLNHNHFITSAASSATQIIAMSVLLEGGLDFTPEQCSEIGLMLSSCATVSAEVPQVLSRVARALATSGRAEEFRALDPKAGLGWLDTNMPKLYRDVTKFLNEHGHRALMEFDLATKPWALAPEQLIEAVQNMRVTKDDNQMKINDIELIASLTTPKKFSTRKLLEWLLPMSRRMVVYRESTKASLILSLHKLRLAIIQLSNLMVRKWMLPHPDLIFYFRLYELKNYLATRDPVLLRKAHLRRQHTPGWSRLQFPEMSSGWPRPRARDLAPRARAHRTLAATPVCAGDVVARAAVVRDISEIGHLKQGDILITHSTDIGWSPYFPLLSGIVTELGGLVSHGAVIAREYGLPCIVGAAGATVQFQTGDLVRLSGAAGTLEKLQPEQTDCSVETNFYHNFI